jgi:Protein of unknown function (DUF3105)
MLLLVLALLGAASCGGPDPAPAGTTGPAAGTASVAPSPTAAPSCGTAAQQPDQGHLHVVDLNQAYAQHPATSGPHYPVPLPPQPAVYTAPVPEARAVHNLEHGYVWVYYQAAGADALPAPAVDALRSAAAGQRKVLMAPYPQLPAGAALDFAAWDELQQCGSGVTPSEAIAALGAFVTAYREGPLAPEPGAA